MNALIYFLLFFKASLFSTGGLGNLPFLNQDLIDLGWATPSDFLTAIAVGNPRRNTPIGFASRVD